MYKTVLLTATVNYEDSYIEDKPCQITVMKEVCAHELFTFETFLVKDDCVVLWCLCQAEKLASEKQERKTQMEGDMWLANEKT